ncbi:hypothetical protein ES703_114510 [subsurface metagenome]
MTVSSKRVPFPFDTATERVDLPINRPRLPLHPAGRSYPIYIRREQVGVVTSRVKPCYREILSPNYIRLLEAIFTRPKYRYIYKRLS